MVESGRDLRVVAGSERAPAAVPAGALRPAGAEVADVTVRLRPASPTKARRVYERSTRRRPSRARPLSRAALARLVAASAVDARAVESFAHRAGLTVVEVSLPRRSVVLRGPVRALEDAFSVSLERIDTPAGSFRQRTGVVHVPAAIAGAVTGVFGLDDRPQARAHFRVRSAAAAAGAVSYAPPAVATRYAFPAGTTGRGETIGIIELGGGYRSTDLTRYFTELSLTPPNVVAVAVDGGQNAPTGSADGPDGEVALDIEIAGSLAPDAAIAVYFAPNTDRGFIDAVTAAVHDTHHAPTVLSISWGGPESSWTAQARTALDEALAEAAAIGMAVCVAAGDNGASDGVTDGARHVDFPASSPHAIACGGTTLRGSAAAPDETVWNDLATNNGATGGGFSSTFPAPAWQRPVLGPFAQTTRGVPDVSGDADPATGYDVLVDGSSIVVGGTSAVAPLWAGLIARCQEASGRRPVDLAARLYGARSAGFRDITVGDNGGYDAAVGWDPCTGLGVPIGSALLASVWGAAVGQAGPTVAEAETSR